MANSWPKTTLYGITIISGTVALIITGMPEAIFITVIPYVVEVIMAFFKHIFQL